MFLQEKCGTSFFVSKIKGGGLIDCLLSHT